MIGTTLLSELGRAVERACGTRRFAGATLAARCAMEIVFEARGAREGSGDDASGPYGVVFALLAMYGREIPATATYAAGVGPLSFALSDKSLTYFSALCLALGRGIVSARLALIGTFAGYVVTDGIGLDHRALARAGVGGEPVQRLRRARADHPRSRESSTARARRRGRRRTERGEHSDCSRPWDSMKPPPLERCAEANDDVQRATNILLTA